MRHRLSPGLDDVVAGDRWRDCRAPAPRRRLVRARASWPRSWWWLPGPVRATMGSSTATTAGRGNASGGRSRESGRDDERRAAGEARGSPHERRARTRCTGAGRGECGYGRAATQSARPSVYQAVTAAAASHVATSMMASPSPTTVAASVGRVAVRATIVTATAVSNEEAEPSHTLHHMRSSEIASSIESFGPTRL